MSKKKSWSCLIKWFLFPEPHHHHQQKRSKRSRIWAFGRLKRTKGLPPPPPPLPLPTAEYDAEENQSKWEEDVSKPISECNEEVVPKSSDCIPLQNVHDMDVESLASIKIQTAYRGYLARKALRALKGFVRLQAIIRGRAVRRQAMTTLKCLQAIVDIQSEVCTQRSQMAQAKYRDLQLQGLQGENLKMEINRHRRLDNGLLPKVEEIDIILRQKEAILRKQRSKAHSFNHRGSTDSEDSKAEGRLRNWLEQYVKDQVLPNKEHKTVLKHLKLKNTEGLNLKSISLHRRSFHTHRKQSSSETTGLNPGSPTTTPTYMAATESARAKARSTSSPRVRPDRAYSDGDSPYKHKLISPMSSIRSEMTCSGFSRVSNKSSCCSNSQQTSPNLKGLPGSLRSNRKMKDISLDSESLVVSKVSR